MALLNVIKWETNSQELVHKFQIDDLITGSQLVVYPGQTAFFVKGGQIFDEFICGTYTIKSENIPLLNKVFNMPFDGVSPFQAEVWFVNQVSILDCKWGTPSPIQIEDPKYGVIVPIRSNGQYGFKIGNPRVFLERLIGNMPSFTVDKISAYFRGVILSKLTAIITQKLYADNLSIINVNSQVEELSDYARSALADVFAEYGVDLDLFNLIAISVNEDDQSFKKLKESKDSLARITIMGKENYQMERSFNVLDSAAENEGGGLIGASVGIGAGMGIGSQIGAMAKEHINTNPVSPVPMPSVHYFIGIEGQQQGPFGFAAVTEMLASRQITENALIWKRGMADWARVGDVAEFRNVLDSCPPPLPTM